MSPRLRWCCGIWIPYSLIVLAMAAYAWKRPTLCAMPARPRPWHFRYPPGHVGHFRRTDAKTNAPTKTSRGLRVVHLQKFRSRRLRPVARKVARELSGVVRSFAEVLHKSGQPIFSHCDSEAATNACKLS